MEIIIALIIIIVICKILGVSNIAIIIGILGLIELLIFAMLLFFCVFSILLLFTKKKKAVFTRFDKPKKGRFKVAYYLVDGTELPCVFPREAGMSGIMYKSDKICTVRFSKTLKKVYDIWSIATCLTGLIFSIFAVVFTLRIITAAGLFI